MSTFKEGEVVFAVSDGYPNWPAVVRGTRKSKGETQWKVRYLGDKEFDSDWLSPNEVFSFADNKAKMSNPSFKNLDADEKEADVKKDFMAALKKAEEVISKPEEPAGRTRGRPSEVAPPSPKASNKRKSTAEAPATSPKRQKSTTPAAEGAAEAAPAEPAPKKGGRKKTPQPEPAAEAAAPEAAGADESIDPIVGAQPVEPASPSRKASEPKETKAAEPKAAEPEKKKPGPKGKKAAASNGSQDKEEEAASGPDAAALKKQLLDAKKEIAQTIAKLQKLHDSIEA